jgi:thiamine kinase-like enzyme
MGDDALWAIIRSVPGWETADLEVAPLEGGITNRNYIVTRADERFVLRVPGQDTDLLGIDRANEYRAASLAADAGVGPAVVAFLPQLGCFVARFVDGESIPEREMATPAVLASVVRSVRALHACPPIPSSFNVFRVVEAYRDVASARGVPIPPAYEEASDLAARIEQAFAREPSPLTFCHDDLLNANFLRSGDHVWIVDYEYAGMGDPFFDLGNLAVNNGLDDEAQEAMLGFAFGDVRDRHRARLALMRLMSDFREAMWGVVQRAISTLDVDYVEYADRHFSRLLTNAAAAPIDDLLAGAGEPA